IVGRGLLVSRRSSSCSGDHKATDNLAIGGLARLLVPERMENPPALRMGLPGYDGSPARRRPVDLAGLDRQVSCGDFSLPAVRRGTGIAFGLFTYPKMGHRRHCPVGAGSGNCVLVYQAGFG